MLYVPENVNKFCLPYHTRIKYKIQVKAKQCYTQKTEFPEENNVNLDGEEFFTLNTKLWLFGTLGYTPSILGSSS